MILKCKVSGYLSNDVLKIYLQYCKNCLDTRNLSNKLFFHCRTLYNYIFYICIIIFYSLGNMHSRMNYAKVFLKYNYYFKELSDICSHNWTLRYLMEIFTMESREPKAISKRKI